MRLATTQFRDLTTITKNIRSPSIALKVYLIGKLSGKQISAKALLDSGAEGMIIHERFVERNHLSTKKLTRPLPAQNVDGTQNTHGSITHSTIQRLRIHDPIVKAPTGLKVS